MARILFLADINSIHTRKWMEGLSGDNFQIGIFSLNQRQEKTALPPGIIVLNESTFFQRRVFSKIAYLFVLPKLWLAVWKFKPNIIHAHYASSYGLLGALTFFKPLFVSAWGSDVMEFPRRSFIHRIVLKYVLNRATRIFATSSVLEEHVSEYTKKNCSVIPFGVDLNHFYRFEAGAHQHFLFGCIKHLEKIYNIDKVILAFHNLLKKYPHAPLRLLIVGKGSEHTTLVNLIATLNLQQYVEIAGEINHSMVPAYLNRCDVLVNISEMESFGVSVAEAQACGIPVIVSNIPGFKDLVPDENFGLIADGSDVAEVAKCMEKYYLDSELRKAHADAGRRSVLERFNWEDNLQQMEKFYYELLQTGLR